MGVLHEFGPSFASASGVQQTIRGVVEKEISIVVGENPGEGRVGEPACFLFEARFVAYKPKHARAQTSEQEEEDRRNDEGFHPTDRFSLPFCEEVNRRRKAQVTADDERIDADREGQERSISKPPDQQSEPPEGAPATVQPAHPMHANPDEIELKPEKKGENPQAEHALDIAGQDKTPEREALKAKRQDRQQNQKQAATPPRLGVAYDCCAREVQVPSDFSCAGFTAERTKERINAPPVMLMITTYAAVLAPVSAPAATAKSVRRILAARQTIRIPTAELP